MLFREIESKFHKTSIHVDDDESYISTCYMFVSVQECNGLTKCFSFDSTYVEVHEALNDMPFIGKDGVVVVKVD